MQKSQHLPSPPTEPDADTHPAAPKDRSSQQQPSCEPSFHMACHNLNPPPCENAMSLDIVSDLAALRAAIREQNCFISNNLERVLDEQRNANKIVLSAIHRLQNDVSQLKSPSHLPFSHFVDSISPGFTKADAVPQTYISPYPPIPSLFPANLFMAPHPLTTPPLRTTTDLKAELERCTTLPPPKQPAPDTSTTSHTTRSPQYAFNTFHEDGPMSVEQALHFWSPKPDTPQPPSDLDQEEETSTTDVESPDNGTTKLRELLNVLERKTVTSDDSEESTNSTSGKRTPPIVPTSRFTPYFVEHPRSRIPTPEWVVQCNMYGQDHVDDTLSEPGAQEYDSTGILDDERVEMPTVYRVATPVSPFFQHHRPIAVPDDHPATGTDILIGRHYDIDPAWVCGGVVPAKQTEDRDSSRVTTPALPKRPPSTTSSRYHTGEAVRPPSPSGPISIETRPPTWLPFYDMIGGLPQEVHLASPSEKIFTRSPPPSFSPSRCSSPPPHDGPTFKSPLTLQAPITPPHPYFGQQPPPRSPSELSERYLSPSLIPVGQVYDYPPINPAFSQPPSTVAAIPPSPPPRIYGTPTSSSSSSTSSPLPCNAMSPTFRMRSVTPPKMDFAARSERSARSPRRPDLSSPTNITRVPTYGDVTPDSPSPLMPSAQRGPRPQACASGSPVITPALTADYTHSPTGSAAITYGSPRPMISPTNSLGLQDDTAFPEQTLTLRQAKDSSLRMQRLENLVEMLQTKVLSLTDELSTIKGSPTTPRMSAASPIRHSDIPSPPPPMFFYTPPARSAGIVASSPKSDIQPQPLAQLRSYSDRLASPPSNRATVSMMATPLTSAPSSRMPYPKSPEMEGPPVLPIYSTLVCDIPEFKPHRRQRTATAIPPPEVTYGGGMAFRDACSLGQESSDGNSDADQRRSSPVLSPSPLPLPVLRPHFEASPPPAPVTLNLEQPASVNMVIPHSPTPLRSTSPTATQNETTRTLSKPLHLGKMARPRRARKHQLHSVNNGANASSAADKLPPAIVPTPCYLREGPGALVNNPEASTLPRLQESSLNQLPSLVPGRLFDFPETTQDRQPILSPPSPPSPPGVSFRYGEGPYQFAPWRQEFSRVPPSPVTSFPPIRSRSSFPTLTPAYQAAPPRPFMPTPGIRGAASQTPYQPRRSRPRGTPRNVAAPPISVLAPPAPAPLCPVAPGYLSRAPNNAAGMGSTTRAYAPHILRTRPSYPYVTTTT